jgi:hypothetical protein
MRASTRSRTLQDVALAGLVIVLAIQAVEMLFALGVLGLGGAPVWQSTILLVGVGGATALALVLFTKVLRHAWKPATAAWAVLALVVDLLAFVMVLGPAD